ncbi:hypothetical protein [Roseovarius aestuariivivens]|uniref:hypothetical protein n=1 Tax=Roseovarius aestuariivivens TaxID=1888910 RepID=UPI0010805167|nr:hypothetical protein [Roseovarius aestuariivivens]
MVEKVLHAGNIAATLAAVATATEITLAGGSVSAIGAALSGHALFRKLDTPDKVRALEIAERADAHLKGDHLTPDRRKILIQMFAAFLPSDSDLATGSMQPAPIVAHMQARIRDEARDSAYRTETALDDYAALLHAILPIALQPASRQEAMLQELLARTDDSEGGKRMREEGITERAIIRLAQRVAQDTDDLAAAWRELQNAMYIAVRLQREGQVTSN